MDAHQAPAYNAGSASWIRRVYGLPRSSSSRLQYVAHDAMPERGPLPDSSPAVVAEVDALTHAATTMDATVRDLRRQLLMANRYTQEQ